MNLFHGEENDLCTGALRNHLIWNLEASAAVFHFGMISSSCSNDLQLDLIVEGNIESGNVPRIEF